MNKSACRVGFITGAQLVMTAVATAQYVANNQTVTVDGVTSSWSGSYYVGNTTWADALFVANGGHLAVTNGEGRLGNTAGSSNNTALISGAGSLWTNSSTLTIGYGGCGNQLLITASGTVCNAAGTIGNTAGASNNTVCVTGSGSSWRNSGSIISVGALGSANQLTVTNGAAVYGLNVQLGALGGSNNSALLTGGGSVWSNTANFTVGQSSGGHNQLFVLNGGTLFSAASYVGYGTGAGNAVTLSDTGSTWRCSTFAMGQSTGGANWLTITNGAALLNTGYCVIGGTASNNAVLVSGVGSAMSNSGASYMYLGNTGAMNQLVVLDGGIVYCKGDVTLGKGGGGGNTASVCGSGSVWSVEGFLTATGSMNGLILSNGGVVSVKGGVTLAAGNYLSNYVAGASGGLDLTGGGLTMNGNVHVMFTGAPTVTGQFWGLRWSGNHSNTLEGYRNSGALVIDDTALPSHWQGKASIFYDATNTYVGFVVDKIPEPPHGTTLQVW